MKKFYFLIVLVFASYALMAQDYDYKTMEIPMVEGDQIPELDGSMDDVYYHAPEGTMDNWNENADQGADGTVVEGHTGTFYMVYTDLALYIYAEITDDDFCDADEIGIGFDIGPERKADYGWEPSPQDADAFLFDVITWATYSGAGTEIVKNRNVSIVWNEGDPDYSFEAMVLWEDISTDTQFLYDMFDRGTFLFDIGIKNKYTDDNPAAGDKEYFQWSGNMNDFWQSSMRMGEVTLGDLLTSVNASELGNTKVFPNPAKNILNISNDEQPAHVALRDMTGKTVFESSNCSEQMHIDVSGLQSGLYLLSVDQKCLKVVIK